MLNYYFYKFKNVLNKYAKLIKIMFSIFIVVLFLFNITKFLFTRNVLMAHGLGGVRVNNKIYDINNTYEGFERSYKLGIRNFEVDLMLTNDKKVVAFHPYNQALYKRLNITNTDYSYEEFMSGNYFKDTNLRGLTPLDINDVILLINEYKNTEWAIHIHSMNTHEYTELFLNEITNNVNINKDILNRISIGINYQEELDIFKKYNIYNLIYTLYEKEERAEEVNTNEKLINYLLINGIGRVSMNKNLVDREKELIKELRSNKIETMTYTENSFINQIKLFLKGMDYIETDNLK